MIRFAANTFLALVITVPPLSAQEVSAGPSQPSLADTFRSIATELEGVNSALNKQPAATKPWLTGVPTLEQGNEGKDTVWQQLLDRDDLVVTPGPNGEYVASFNRPNAFVASKVPVSVLAEPKGSAVSTVQLQPGTAVKVEDEQDGFAKIVYRTASSPINVGWLPAEIVKPTGFTSNLADAAANGVTSAMDDAMQRMGTLADSLRNNPYVRLKGFRVTISTSPGVEAEFEMKADSP